MCESSDGSRHVNFPTRIFYSWQIPGRLKKKIEIGCWSQTHFKFSFPEWSTSISLSFVWTVNQLINETIVGLPSTERDFLNIHYMNLTWK